MVLLKLNVLNLLLIFKHLNQVFNIKKFRLSLAVVFFLILVSCATKKAALVSEDEPQELQSFENFEEAFTEAAERSVVGNYVGKGRASNLVIYFDFNSAYLALDGRTALNKEIDSILKALQGRGKNNLLIRIEGHTDERGSNEYNLALGQRRSDSIARYMFSKGVDRNKIQSVSYGETRPLATGSDESAWAENRRVEINY